MNAFRFGIQKPEGCEAQLAAASKRVGIAMAQMLTAATQGNEPDTQMASEETLATLRLFANAVRALVASSPADTVYQHKLIDSARLVLQHSSALMGEISHALAHKAQQQHSHSSSSASNSPSSSSAASSPGDSSAQQQQQQQQRLVQLARVIAQSLYECVNYLPSQQDMDAVIARITHSASLRLFDTSTPSAAAAAAAGDLDSAAVCEKTRMQAQYDLSQSALALNQAIGRIVAETRLAPKSQQQQQQQQRDTNKLNVFSEAFSAFVDNGLVFVALEKTQPYQQQQQQQQEQILSIQASLKQVFAGATRLLQAAKGCMVESSSSAQRQQLSACVRQLADTISHAVDVCLGCGGGGDALTDPLISTHKECDHALRSLHVTRILLQAQSEQIWVCIAI